MLIQGGIYTFEKSNRIIICFEDDIVIFYRLPCNNDICSKANILQELNLQEVEGFDGGKLTQTFDESFQDLNTGFLGTIDKQMLDKLQSFYMKWISD